MSSRLIPFLAIVAALLSACGSLGRTALPPDLTVEEHALIQAPTSDPFDFKPLGSSMESLSASHAAERSKQFSDNSLFLDGHFSMRVTLGKDTLTATENYDSTGQHGWVTLNRNATEIYRIATGIASPITALRGLWAYDGHWVLETVDITAEQAVGKLSLDGQVLNDRYGYDEAFAFQLMHDRPFYFFRKGGKLGVSYADQQIAAGYDEIPHYECCSASVLNPRQAENMISFFARRDHTWYYIEAGVFK